MDSACCASCGLVMALDGGREAGRGGPPWRTERRRGGGWLWRRQGAPAAGVLYQRVNGDEGHICGGGRRGLGGSRGACGYTCDYLIAWTSAAQKLVAG